MRKLLSLAALLLSSVAIFAQNDKAYLHNGKTVEVKIHKVAEFTITFSYPNETAEQTVSKYMVKKVEYASGRTEEISEKIVVSSEDDWENVVILEDKAATVGLVKKEEIRGKTNGVFGIHTAASADKKSMKKLKEAAAALGCPFILLTSDKDNQFTGQSIKKAIAYNYK